MAATAPADLVLEDAVRICAVPAPTFAEQARAQLVAGMLATAGAPARLDAVGNVICGFGPEEQPAVVFAAHLDTVFGPEQPLEVRRDPDGRRIHAPGIGDNSLGVAALVHLARRLAGDPPAAARVLLVATVGEEGLGDLRGVKHLLDAVPCAAFVAVEGAMLGSIKTAAIGSTRLRVTFRGPGGHSWADRGTPSAVHGLLERATRFLASPAPDGAARNIGRISGGTSINTIAAQATLELDLRAERPGPLAQAAAAARTVFGQAPRGLQSDIEIIGERPSGAIAPDHPLLAAARRARAHAGLPPAEEGASSTDANAAHGLGIPAITVGLTTGGGAHRIDEFIDTEPLAGGLTALERLLDELTDR